MIQNHPSRFLDRVGFRKQKLLPAVRTSIDQEIFLYLSTILLKIQHKAF